MKSSGKRRLQDELNEDSSNVKCQAPFQSAVDRLFAVVSFDRQKIITVQFGRSPINEVGLFSFPVSTELAGPSNSSEFYQLSSSFEMGSLLRPSISHS
jgi:hypothetical protein